MIIHYVGFPILYNIPRAPGISFLNLAVHNLAISKNLGVRIMGKAAEPRQTLEEE